MLIIEMCTLYASRFYIKSHEFIEFTSASAVKTCNLSICVCSRRADRSFSVFITWVKELKRRKTEEGAF